jgi:hypothetical protein
LALKKSQAGGTLTGIKVSRIIKILHLLFVDDILIMTKASIPEWMEIKMLLNSFCCASRLMINAQKTSFLHFGIQQPVLDSLKASFLFNFHDLINGFRYLGYFLKLGRPRFEDWQWLIDKYEKCISHWCNRCLSIGGHLVLIKAVLEIQPVYWLALANLPPTVYLKIHQLMFNFL